jgi:crossover junction endodeoxyribonuclease RusA
MKRWLDLSAEEVEVMNAAARAAHRASRRRLGAKEVNEIASGNIRKASQKNLTEKAGSTALYIDIQASWPPSVNHYWERNRDGSMRIGRAGLAYRKEIAAACYGRGKIMGPCGIEITAYPPDRRERDIDNILKALLDAIAKAGAIESDKYIDVISIVRVRDAVVDGGDIRARITPIRYPL